MQIIHPHKFAHTLPQTYRVRGVGPALVLFMVMMVPIQIMINILIGVDQEGAVFPTPPLSTKTDQSKSPGTISRIVYS